MRTTTITDGIANWARLQAVADAALAASPALARRSARFNAALSRRQSQRLARVLASPDSKEYKDYISPAL